MDYLKPTVHETPQGFQIHAWLTEAERQRTGMAAIYANGHTVADAERRFLEEMDKLATA